MINLCELSLYIDTEDDNFPGDCMVSQPIILNRDITMHVLARIRFAFISSYFISVPVVKYLQLYFSLVSNLSYVAEVMHHIDGVK